MQGRKGIGRYAASILGTDLFLETITPDGEKTDVHLEWAKFRNAEYLSDVEIEVTSEQTSMNKGTTIRIIGGGKYRTVWTRDEISDLRFEMRKLISPVESLQGKKVGNVPFKINMVIDGFFYDTTQQVVDEIKPLPLFDLYDYRIHGRIDKKGTGELTFVNNKARNTVDEIIKIELGRETGCGTIEYDIRVYDREPDAIDQIIKRGLKDSSGNFVGKNEAKNLLNKNNGIGVYRNGFRIRPLGDPDFDWLKLNEQRIQMPSMRIGSNQVIGYVEIESEELSNLEEKSARDGLRDNDAFISLKFITTTVINRLEERRYAYRSKAGLSRTIIKVEKELEKIFNYEEIIEELKSKLDSTHIDKKVKDEIYAFIVKKEEESNRIVDDIRTAVAVYQGQATLGKIINVILHDGRKPLNYFKNQIPNLNFWIDTFDENNARSYFEEILPIVDGIKKNTEQLVTLFGKLDPLAAGKRKPRESFNIVTAIEKSFHVFEEELLSNKIVYSINCKNKNIQYMGWSADIYIIMTNLIENSIYWITTKNVTNGVITVDIVDSDGRLIYFDYKDNGPGIEKHLIEGQVIFEPEFSTKPAGTGLGLAIAGEAAHRNLLQIQAFDYDGGAYFRLQPTNQGG